MPVMRSSMDGSMSMNSTFIVSVVFPPFSGLKVTRPRISELPSLSNGSKGLVPFVFDDFHFAANRRFPSGDPPANDRSHANRPLRHLLQVHVRIPSRVVLDMIGGKEAEDFGDGAVDDLR